MLAALVLVDGCSPHVIMKTTAWPAPNPVTAVNVDGFVPDCGCPHFQTDAAENGSKERRSFALRQASRNGGAPGRERGVRIRLAIVANCAGESSRCPCKQSWLHSRAIMVPAGQDKGPRCGG